MPFLRWVISFFQYTQTYRFSGPYKAVSAFIQKQTYISIDALSEDADLSSVAPGIAGNFNIAMWCLKANHPEETNLVLTVSLPLWKYLSVLAFLWIYVLAIIWHAGFHWIPFLLFGVTSNLFAIFVIRQFILIQSSLNFYAVLCTNYTMAEILKKPPHQNA